jgi:hypothetical protein
MSTAQNAATMEKWCVFGEVDLPELITDLKTKVEAVQGGDMRPVESMLYTQAITLQTIFTNLARRSAMNAGEYINAADKYMRLALKAQAQCRSTLEALAEIKNPRPVSFVRQANISNGPQQVNNGATPDNRAIRAHAEENASLQNELLEHQHGNYLDAGAQGQPGQANPHLEAVGAGQRAAHA